jgi:hypothetical protein
MSTEVSDDVKARRAAGLAKARAIKTENAAKRKEQAVEPPSRQMDSVEVRSKRAALLQELADLPQEQNVYTGAEPGTLIKDGMGFDKVPWTPAILRQYCDEGRVIDGVPFGWKEILGDGRILSVGWQGIYYWLWEGRMNKVPTVHYTVYMQMLDDRRREQEKWQAPVAPGPGQLDGYSSAQAHNDLGHIMGVGPLEPRGE